MCFFTIVHQAEVGLLERLGKFQNSLTAGLHCCLIWGLDEVKTISLRLKQQHVQCDTKTRDNVFVLVHLEIQYKVHPGAVKEAFYNLTNPAAQMSAYATDVVRARVPTLILDDVFEQKDDIAKATEAQLTERMSQHGYIITDVLVTDIDVDAHVKHSMNQINVEARRRVAAHDLAEASKIASIKLAEAESESKYLSGVGLSRQRQAIVNGLHENVSQLSKIDSSDDDAQNVMNLLVLMQFLDTLSEIGSDPTKECTMFLKHAPQGLAELQDQIKLLTRPEDAKAAMMKLTSRIRKSSPKPNRIQVKESHVEDDTETFGFP